MSVRTRASSPGGTLPFYRILDNNYFSSASSETFGTVGRVYLAFIGVPCTLTIDRLGYVVGAAFVGNVRVGLYARGIVGFPDRADGGALIVQSASDAQPGTQRVHWLSVPATQLAPGLYFLALQADDITATYYSNTRFSTWNAITSGRYFDQAYGAFTDPCPATTPTNRFPCALLRVLSVP